VVRGAEVAERTERARAGARTTLRPDARGLKPLASPDGSVLPISLPNAEPDRRSQHSAQ
jgi:hypothetical protein